MGRADADVLIVGGGLAGTAAVQAAQDAGREVVWLDDGAPRASDAPVALVHPFAGGSFRPRPDAARAWAESLRWFCGDAPDGADAPGGGLVHRAVLRRFTQPGARGARLRKSWPLAAATAADLFSTVRSDPDELWFEYGPVLGVDLAAVLAARRAALLRGGVTRLSARAQSLAPHPPAQGTTRWTVETPSATLRARDVVVAAGAGSVALLAPLISTESLARAEGTLAHAPGTAPLERFVVSGGHLSGSRSRVAWGATYRMLDGDVPDPREHEAELARIDARLRAAGAVMPALEDAARWTGVRLVDVRTRQPWVAQPRPGLHLFTAFGSQGGLWIPWHARALAQALAATPDTAVHARGS